MTNNGGDYDIKDSFGVCWDLSTQKWRSISFFSSAGHNTRKNLGFSRVETQLGVSYGELQAHLSSEHVNGL